jgi:4-hydroxy-3-polyprenylbenzoate decarboxylase
MFRAKNERGFDMTCTSHRARINAQKAATKGKNLEIAVVIGAPILDKLAALKGFPPDVDDFEVLGSFYGEAAKLVKCETIDLMVPANAEVVLECELMATEGWVHDEAPFGEFTGMYGGGLKHNVRALVKAITHRKSGIFQYATIGCGHPWYTDNMLQLPAMEADLFGGAQGLRARRARSPGRSGRAEQHRLREDSEARRRRRQAGAVRNAGVVKDGDPEGRLCF